MGYRQAFASFSGPGRTPWDPSRWSGGSSSGPGGGGGGGPGAVRDRLGDVGLDAVSRRLLRRHRAPAHIRPGEPPRRDGAQPDDGQARPLARSAEDCGLVLAAIAGSDPKDPTATGRRFVPPARAARRYRIGILRGTLDRTQPEVRRNFEASLEVLREIADVEEGLELPDYPWDATGRTGARRRGGERVRAAGSERAGHPAHLARGPGRRVRGAGRAGARLPARAPGPAAGGGRAGPPAVGRGRAGRAHASDRGVAGRRCALDQAYPEFPGGTSVAGAANLCGVPALFLMNGTGEAGLPTSLQLTGRAQSEATLLEIGMHYQARTKFHRQRPPGL